MKTLRMLAVGLVSVTLISCSTEENAEVVPEELPVNQEEMAPAEDSVIAGEEPEAEAVKAPAKEKSTLQESAERIGEDVGDGSVTTSTSKKTKNSTALTTPKEEVAKPDGGVTTSTSKKKR